MIEYHGVETRGSIGVADIHKLEQAYMDFNPSKRYYEDDPKKRKVDEKTLKALEEVHKQLAIIIGNPAVSEEEVDKKKMDLYNVANQIFLNGSYETMRREKIFRIHESGLSYSSRGSQTRFLLDSLKYDFGPLPEPVPFELPVGEKLPVMLTSKDEQVKGVITFAKPFSEKPDNESLIVYRTGNSRKHRVDHNLNVTAIDILTDFETEYPTLEYDSDIVIKTIELLQMTLEDEKAIINSFK